MDPKLEDGFACLWSFADYPNISFYEIETTPPGWSGGGPINTTTMRNSVVRTSAPKKLKSMTPAGGTCAYADTVYNMTNAPAMINHKQLITCTLPTGKTITFWGHLDSFQPTGFREGDMPTASIHIIADLENLSNAETLPTVV